MSSKLKKKKKIRVWFEQKGGSFLSFSKLASYDSSKLAMMAVDVVHRDSPTQAYAKMAFGRKSRSIEELSTKTAYPTKMATSHGSMTSINERSSNTSAATGQRPHSSSDKSSTGSMLDLSLIQRSDMAVDQLVSSRKQLEEEIEVARS